MILPEQKHRPVWEPLVIALFLAILILADHRDVQRLFQHRLPATSQARAALEFGVGLMLAWGALRAIYKAAVWSPAAD